MGKISDFSCCRALGALLVVLVLNSCETISPQPDSFSWEKADELLRTGIFHPLKEPPEYVVLEGYPDEYRQAIAAGIDTARTYFGNYGPIRIYILGQTDGVVGAYRTPEGHSGATKTGKNCSRSRESVGLVSTE